MYNQQKRQRKIFKLLIMQSKDSGNGTSCYHQTSKRFFFMNLKYSPKSDQILSFMNQSKYVEDVVVYVASAIDVVEVFQRTLAQVLNHQTGEQKTCKGGNHYSP